ncbi:hypothetical protein [Brumimicrobium mesophilum]|uniref:hypothetical protein n=1 Tax=Brumimicrobium mesophilum TaxID=392717 RepID=UPI000D141EC5|nr:hypothetical protein [Brumimicrobium mesophilum]
MYSLDYDISFQHNGRKFQLYMLDSVEIESDAMILADSAKIVLPEAVLNQVLNINDRIGRGAEVNIKLGYDGNLQNEFTGFVQDITTNDSSLTILCEDALFLFRVPVKDELLVNTNVSKICQSLLDQVNPEYTLVCDYDIGYEKFTINRAEAYDVLKKLQSETKANIYFKTEEKELHVHFPYSERDGEVKYAFDRNIESSSLEYKKAIDRKVEITVEKIDKDGKITTVKSGTPGGEKFNIKVGEMKASDIQKIADAELIKRSADKYEGSFKGWLIPVCRPTYSADIVDLDYPEKDGRYYVSAVATSFSSAGGVRTIKTGIKLS